MGNIDYNKPLFQATIGDLEAILEDLLIRHGALSTETIRQTPKKYVYGLAGLAELMGCSITTAQRVKNSGVINPAISQINRLLVIDAEHALDLIKIDTKWRNVPNSKHRKNGRVYPNPN